MIRHIVFFTARDPADIDSIMASLRELADTAIPAVFEVAPNIGSDPLGDHVDIVVYAEFAGEAELAAYRAHPVYAEVTRKVRPLREMRLAADIRSAGPGFDATDRRDPAVPRGTAAPGPTLLPPLVEESR
ncbi:MAG TPA: Dabb family protein [Bauldia sp.]|nr:Dabb family protein [Bauldia sp.]